MRLHLVPFQDSFLDIIMQWRNEPETLKYNPVERCDREKMLENSRQHLSDLCALTPHKQLRLYFIVKEVLVGTVSLSCYNDKMKTAEIGYMIGQSYYGKGYATLMNKMFIREVFEKTAMRKIIASIHEANLASRRVASKLGFIQEGILREHYLIDGVAVNEAVYGLLRHECSFLGQA